MAQLTIGIGSSANDGTGDPLRTAFTKINTNFTELYGSTAEANDLLEDASPQLGGNLDINGFNITSARSNEDIVIAPSGTGGVLASGIRLAGTQISSDDSSAITIAEALQINGATNISGATTLAAMTATTGSFSSTLAVTGVSTLSGSVVMDNITIDQSTISSSSNADINITPGGTGDVVLSSLRVNGTTLDSSDSTKVTIAEAVDITGATDIAGALTGTSGSFSTTLGVTGVATLSGSAVIDNITIDQSTISSSSNADINIIPGGTGNIVAGALTFNGTSIASADSTTVNINDALNVDSTANIEGTLTTADITATGTVTVTGQADIDWIRIKDNVITTNATNAILNIGANSSGTVNVFNAMTTVGQTITGDVQVTGKIDVDNLRIDGNTISAPSSGGITLTPAAGSNVLVSGTNVQFQSDEVLANLGEFAVLRCDTFQNDTTNGDIVISAQGTGVVDVNTAIMMAEISKPTAVADHGFIYAKNDGGTGEVYVLDAADNETKISPHNKNGEWEYYSKNSRTGKTIRINMEAMIRDLETFTGHTYIEEGE